MNCERKIPGTPRPPSIRISLLTPIENYGFKKRGEGKEKEKTSSLRVRGVHKSLASMSLSNRPRRGVAIKREGLYFNLWRLLFKLLSYIRQLKIPPSCAPSSSRAESTNHESRTRSPYVFMHIQISPPLSILFTSLILFLISSAVPFFVEDPDPLTWWRACEIENHPPGPLSPRPASGGPLCTWMCIEKKGKGRGVDALLPFNNYTLRFVKLVRYSCPFKRAIRRLGDEDGASVGAPRCDEDEEAEREKKIGFKIGAEASYLLERNIFLPCFVRCGKRSATLSPRFIVRRWNDRWIGNFEAPNHPRDRPTCFSLSSRWISCYERQRRFTIIIFPVNYSDSLRGGEKDACVCTCAHVRCTMLEFTQRCL